MLEIKELNGPFKIPKAYIVKYKTEDEKEMIIEKLKNHNIRKRYYGASADSLYGNLANYSEGYIIIHLNSSIEQTCSFSSKVIGNGEQIYNEWNRISFEDFILNV